MATVSLKGVDTRIEQEVIATVLQGHPVPLELLSHMEPEHFEVQSYQWFVKILKARNWKPLPAGLLDSELSALKDVDTVERYRSQLSPLYSHEVTFSEEAVERFREFVSYRQLNSGFTEAFSAYNRTGRIDFLLDSIKTATVRSQRIIEDEGLEVHDLALEYEERQDRRRQERDNPDLSPRILTGVPGLDEQFVIRSPMLVDFLAPFKRYKSIILNALSFSALLQGFNVLHLTYENSYELTSDRYDSMFSGLGYDRISNLLITEEEKAQLDAMWGWIDDWPNRLKIIKCKSQETTVSEVSEQLQRLRDDEGFSPDVEIWDYLNIIAPSKRYQQERLDQRQIVWDLKGHAEEWGVAILTASQSNMEGAISERLQLHHRGKSIDISQGLDLSIAIDQTEDEREEGIIVLSPMFARNAEIRIPEIVLDTDIPRMQIDPCFYRLWQHAQRVNPPG